MDTSSHDLDATLNAIRDARPHLGAELRDQLLFEAGRAAAGRPKGAGVPLSLTCAGWLVAIGLGVLTGRQWPASVERNVPLALPSQPAASDSESQARNFSALADGDRPIRSIRPAGVLAAGDRRLPDSGPMADAEPGTWPTTSNDILTPRSVFDLSRSL